MHYSIGSQLTKSLITFRNLNGSEENWPNSAKIKPGYSFYMKAAVAEIGFALIPIVSVIELVVYAWIFVPYSLGVYFLSNKSNEKPLYSTVELVVSVQNTLIWNIHNLYRNLITYDFSTCEPDILQKHSKLKELVLRNQELGLWNDDLHQHTIRLEELNNKNELFSQDNIQVNEFLDESFRSFELLHFVLEKPSNLALKIDIRNEMSPIAFELLSFLTIAQCLSRDISEEDLKDQIILLSKATQEQLTTLYADKPFRKQLKKFLITYRAFLTPAHFDKLADAPQLSNAEKQIYLRIKGISSPAIQGCQLFSEGLDAYCKFKDFLKKNPLA